MKKLFILWIIFILLVKTSLAIVATSPNYSVNMFGNSFNAGVATSSSYSVNFLSEDSGSNGFASGNSFKGNIGFFEGPYFSPISIDLYAINPKILPIGSTISLTIFSNGAQNVWAEITAPNSQHQIINLVNGQTLNYLPVPSIIGRYSIIFYANNSIGEVASVADYFDLIESSVSSQIVSSNSGGSAGNSKIIQQCNYNWNCTPWSLCSNGLQERQCKNVGTCIGNDSRPIESMPCNQALFDISLNFEKIHLTDREIKFRINLEEKFGAENLDVHLKYSIINSENIEIFSQIETRAIKGKISFEKSLLTNLKYGKYKLRVDVLYGNLQRALAEQSFEFQDPKSTLTGFILQDYFDKRKMTFSAIIFVLALFILLIAYYYLRNNPIIFSKSIKSIVGLEVYTERGIKVGSVCDLIICERKLDGFVVILDKELNIPYEKVLIRYGYIKDIKNILIVDSKVLE